MAERGLSAAHFGREWRCAHPGHAGPVRCTVTGRDAIGKENALFASGKWIATCATVSLIGTLAIVPDAKASPATPLKGSTASLFLTGIAINKVSLMTGTKITEKSDNACTEMLGKAGTPSSVTAVAIFDADGVPASAAATVSLVTPFQTVTGSGKFSKVMFLATNLWGGVVPAGNYYRFANVQGGSIETVDGKYVVSATASFGGDKLSAHGSVIVDC
jgi:hypothetical protein